VKRQKPSDGPGNSSAINCSGRVCCRQRELRLVAGVTGSKDVFVHILFLPLCERASGSLNEGQAIEYETEGNRGRESAVNLKIK
jgi:cold shock CspA family protein